MNEIPQNVVSVVSAHLCTGCSTCAFVCPVQAIKIVESCAGFLLPHVDDVLCTNCGLCVKVCPGRYVDTGNTDVEINFQKGRPIGTYLVRTTDRTILEKSQSGGAATAILSSLLRFKRVDSAIVTSMPENGTLRPEAISASNENELLRACGSKYCHVPLAMAFPKGQQEKSLAIVGLPCHIHGIRNLRNEGFLKSKIEIIVGLICDRVQSYLAIDYLIEKANIKEGNVAGFEYRSKALKGWPGDVHIKLSDGRSAFLPSKERQLIKDVFTPVRCRLCFDKFNIFSDIVLGDAWGFSKEKEGCSLVIVRTQRGLDCLLNAQQEGFISMSEVSVDDCFEKQSYRKFCDRWNAYTIAWKKIGYSVPDFQIPCVSLLGLFKRLYFVHELKWARKFSMLSSGQAVKRAIRRRLAYERFLSVSVVKTIFRWVGYTNRL